MKIQYQNVTGTPITDTKPCYKCCFIAARACVPYCIYKWVWPNTTFVQSTQNDIFKL